MPASRCSRATWRRRPKPASSTPSATCCGRRSPSGTAASWTVDGGSTRRRRGRENSPSRPTIRGMTVVDRPTISEQFFGRFHAHGFPNRWKTPSIYIYFCTRPSAPVDRRGRWVFFNPKWGPSPNTVHFSTLIAFLMSIGGSGLSVRRRNGKLLILRLTPRGLRRLRLEETSSSRISSSTAS